MGTNQKSGGRIVRVRRRHPPLVGERLIAADSKFCEFLKTIGPNRKRDRARRKASVLLASYLATDPQPKTRQIRTRHR
jgi:hypothetical protein